MMRLENFYRQIQNSSTPIDYYSFKDDLEDEKDDRTQRSSPRLSGRGRRRDGKNDKTYINIRRRSLKDIIPSSINTICLSLLLFSNLPFIQFVLSSSSSSSSSSSPSSKSVEHQKSNEYNNNDENYGDDRRTESLSSSGLKKNPRNQKRSQQIVFLNSEKEVERHFVDDQEPRTNTSTTTKVDALDENNYHQEAPQTYRGWSSWSLQAFKGQGYGFYWLTESHVKSQAKILSEQFLHLGYNRVNLDSGWQDQRLDPFGRYQLDRIRFPGGIHHLQSFLNERGLKLGLYFLPGIDSRAVDNRLLVLNTEYTADQLIQCPKGKFGKPVDRNCRRPLANAFGAGYALNYTHPGSQMYINSIVDQLYQWNVSFVKVDGNVPGSSFHSFFGHKCDTTNDLLAWRRAIEERFESEWKYAGREKIWMVSSWEIPVKLGPILDQAADSWRVSIDIEEYGQRMTTFDRVVRNAKKASVWSSVDDYRRYNGLLDLDAVLVSDMTIEESRSMVTIWAMLGTPFYMGDDLTKLSKERKSLLMNPEVLKIQALTASNPARLHHFNITQLIFPSSSSWNQTSSSSEKDKERMEKLKRKKFREEKLQEFETWRKKLELINESSLGGQKSLLELEKMDFEEFMGVEYSKFVFENELQKEEKEEWINVKEVDYEEDEWTRQIWVSENDGGEIYLAVVNAGRQEWFDVPIEVEISLNDLVGVLSESTRSNRFDYRIRDLWKRIDLGFVSFNGKFKVRLDVHDCILYKFSIV